MTGAPPAQSAYPWLNFTHPAVRDLAFALASPPLLATWPPELAPSQIIELPEHSFWLAQYQRYLPRLLALDHNPIELEQALARVASTRLGVRFETLLSFWLKDKSDAWHDFLLLGQNIQLKDHKRTIGEVDFLIENQVTSEIEHWELSLKFYLGEGQLQAFDWRGLNDRDTFGRKIRHTVLNQFTVSQINYPTENGTHNTKTISRRRAIFKGRLFYPDHTQAIPPTWLHTAHLRGSWGYHLLTGIHWRRAARREWLTPEPSPTELLPPVLHSPIYLIHGLYLGYTQNMPTEMTNNPALIERMIRVHAPHLPFHKAYTAHLYPASIALK